MCGPPSFISDGRSAACLVTRPAMRLRHIRKDDAFISRRIRAMTADSLSPNCSSIASNVVRSSHAISMILEMSAGSNSVLKGCEFMHSRVHQLSQKYPPAADGLTGGKTPSNLGLARVRAVDVTERVLPFRAYQRWAAPLPFLRLA